MYNSMNKTEAKLTSIQKYLQHANENLQKNNPKLAADEVKKARRSLEKLKYEINQSESRNNSK